MKSNTYLKKECKRILNDATNIALGYVAKEEDKKFLLSVFQNHEHWLEKSKGQKILKIEIRRSKGYRNSCFYLVREDGKSIDISYISAVEGKTKIKNIQNACRTAEKPRVIAFKKTVTYPFYCPIDDTLVTCDAECHIDHYNSDFRDVVNDWVKLNGGVDEVFRQIAEGDECDCITAFKPESCLADSFAEYSKSHSHIRAISMHANLSTRKKLHIG